MPRLIAMMASCILVLTATAAGREMYLYFSQSDCSTGAVLTLSGGATISCPPQDICGLNGKCNVFSSNVNGVEYTFCSCWPLDAHNPNLSEDCAAFWRKPPGGSAQALCPASAACPDGTETCSPDGEVSGGAGSGFTCKCAE